MTYPQHSYVDNIYFTQRDVTAIHPSFSNHYIFSECPGVVEIYRTLFIKLVEA